MGIYNFIARRNFRKLFLEPTPRFIKLYLFSNSYESKTYTSDNLLIIDREEILEKKELFERSSYFFNKFIKWISKEPTVEYYIFPRELNTIYPDFQFILTSNHFCSTKKSFKFQCGICNKEYLFDLPRMELLRQIKQLEALINGNEKSKKYFEEGLFSAGELKEDMEKLKNLKNTFNSGTDLAYREVVRTYGRCTFEIFCPENHLILSQITMKSSPIGTEFTPSRELF